MYAVDVIRAQKMSNVLEKNKYRLKILEVFMSSLGLDVLTYKFNQGAI